MKTVIEMAEACGIPEFSNNESQVENIMAFAELVRANERERIIAANATEIEKINAHIKALEAAVLAEREACAKVCDLYTDSSSDNEAGTAINIQDAIRARGQA